MMGFSSYGDYLNSPLWIGIRATAFRLHGVNCKICNNKAVVIHHISYRRPVLLGKDLTALVPLCDGCHHKIEFNQYNEKRTLADAQHEFNVMMRIDCKPVLPKKKNKVNQPSKRKSRTKKQRRRLEIERMGGTGSGSVANYQRVLKEYEMRTKK